MSQGYGSLFYKITSENRRDLLTYLLRGMTKIGFQGYGRKDNQILYRITSPDVKKSYGDGTEPMENIIEKFNHSPQDSWLTMDSIWLDGVNYIFDISFYIDDQIKEANQFAYVLYLSLPSSQIFWEPENIAGFLNIFKNLCQAISPNYALADDDHKVNDEIGTYESRTRRTGDVRIEKLLNNQVMDVYWINYFGKKLVNTFGADKIRNAPYCNVEMFDNGGALLFQPLSERFDNVNSYFDYKRKLAEYLGIDTSWKEIIKQPNR